MNTIIENISNAVLLQGCTISDIEKTINRAVEQAMNDFLESIRDRPDPLIKRVEAAKRLGISLPTIDAYARAGILHAKHIGGRVFFQESELSEIQKK